MKKVIFLMFTVLFLQNNASATSGVSLEIFSPVLLENDCNAVDYSTTDFLVVKNIKEFLSQEGYYSGSIDDVFDTKLKLSVQDFQRDMGIRIDGIVGPTTHKMMQNYDSCSKTSIVKLISCYGGDYKAYLACTSPYDSLSIDTITTTTKQTTSTTSSEDLEPPVWDKTQPPFASEIGSLFNLNMPSVTDNVGIVSYEVYVNGVLSSHVSISEFKLLVTPRFDMTCAEQFIYVIAYDEAGNFSQSPTFSIPRSDLCIHIPINNQQYFAVTFGGIGKDVSEAIAVDSSGNSYITGYFDGTVDFGGGEVTASGSTDIFILKLNSAGSFQWVKTYGGTGEDMGYDIAVDSSGNSYITGIFSGNANFGCCVLTSIGSNDIFILKLNSSGSFLSIYSLGGASTDVAYGIAVDSSGNSYITGYFQGTVDFGGGDVTASFNASVFILKLNSSFQYQWVEAYNSENVLGKSIDVDPLGNSYTTGTFFTDINFGGNIKTSQGQRDIYILKESTNGSGQWIKTFGGVGDDIVTSIAVDSSGNSYITGYFEGTVDFGGGEVTASGNTDIFILKLNSAGSFKWVKTYGGNGVDMADQGYGIAVDSSGNTYTTGYFQGALDFGSGPINASNEDIFILKLNSSGSFQWVKTFGSEDFDQGSSIAVDSSGNSFTTGIYMEDIDFGTGNINVSGSSDIFILKLNSSGGGVE